MRRGRLEEFFVFFVSLVYTTRMHTVVWPNEAAQARRAQGVRRGTVTPSRRGLKPRGRAA